MSKPWEQEWRTEGCCWVERRDDVTAIAQVKTSGAVEEQAVYSRFLAAAPDMARALMRRLDGCSHTGSRVRGCEEEEIHHLCASCEAKAALRKAGVLP